MLGARKKAVETLDQDLTAGRLDRKKLQQGKQPTQWGVWRDSPSQQDVAEEGEGAESRDLPQGYKPSEEEPFMNASQQLYFKRKLLAWKKQLLGETQETLDNMTGALAAADSIDVACGVVSQSLELRTRDRERKLIHKIDEALQRIEDGTYGYCEETGEPISLRRLEARPIATLSIEAQERHERHEKEYSED